MSHTTATTKRTFPLERDQDLAEGEELRGDLPDPRPVPAACTRKQLQLNTSNALPSATSKNNFCVQPEPPSPPSHPPLIPLSSPKLQPPSWCSDGGFCQ
uniref:Uncharacterized protein n=1 Tax=Knipowitschia caucasica TaxID=637954 RepID=A0AAV2MG14_KNICA